MLSRLTTLLLSPLHLRSLSQLFSSPNAQSSPLSIFFRCHPPTLLSFQSSLSHIYTHLPTDPTLLLQLPSLLHQISLLPSPTLYLKLFSLKTLPHLQDQDTLLKKIYVEHLSKNLEGMTASDVYKIGQNLSILLKQTEKSDIFMRGSDDPTLTLVFRTLLQTFSLSLPLYQHNIKYSMLLLSKGLHIYHPPFTSHILDLLIQSHRQFTLLQTLTILSYLSDARSFPKHFFYQMKDEWLKIIAPSEILLDKNQACLLKLLEILAKERIVYWERVVERVWELVRGNLGGLDGTDLVRVVYYGVKGRWEVEEVIREVVGRLGKVVGELGKGEVRLLMVAMGRVGKEKGEMFREIIEKEEFWEKVEEELERDGEDRQILKQEENTKWQKEYFRNLKQVLQSQNKN